jgi:hypothetical protein
MPDLKTTVLEMKSLFSKLVTTNEGNYKPKTIKVSEVKIEEKKRTKKK